MSKTTKKKRRRKGSGKGSAFERDVCKQLSRWWTEKKRDDIFWRTSGSGARATTRSKKGKGTANQYGDVHATDPIGQPLIDLCTIEIKKGYGNRSYFDLIDKLPSETNQPYKKFLLQAIQQHFEAETEWWLLITKRDYKVTMIAMPLGLRRELAIFDDCSLNRCNPSLKCTFNLSDKKIKVAGTEKIFITTLDQFFKHVPSDCFKKL